MEINQNRVKVKERIGLLLDIDNTLSATSKSFFSFLAERFGVPDGETVESLFARYQYSWRVPMWQTREIEEVSDSLEYSNSHHQNMEVIEEARQGVSMLRGMIPIVAYITTRPEVLRNATEKWLAKNGFPLAPVVMRPDSLHRKSGNAWKVEQVKTLFKDSIGIVDDHHDVGRGLADDYDGTVFIFGGRAPNICSNNTIHCPTWNMVVESLFSLYPEGLQHGNIQELRDTGNYSTPQGRAFYNGGGTIRD